MTAPLFLSFSTALFRSLRGLLGSALAGLTGGVLALFLLAAPAGAQTAAPTDPAPDRSAWQTHYGEQAALMLRSDDEKKRSMTLQTLIRITSEGRMVDLSPAVPALFELYGSDLTLNHRIMAVTVLRQVASRSVEGDQIMQRLGALAADQSSKRVQQLTLMALADYEIEQGRVLRLPPDLYDLVVSWGRA